MNAPLFMRILLALHIMGLVIMAGTTVIDYVTFKTFWKLALSGDRPSGLLPLMARYGILVRTGGALLLITGIMMLVAGNGVWWQQIWFRIKMLLVVLLVLNGMFVGNKQGHQFREAIAQNAVDLIDRTTPIKNTLNLFYVVQLTLFLFIILVSVIPYARKSGI